MPEPLVALENLTRTFGLGKMRVTAVDNVSLTIDEGEIVCLVGESGCGKTTTGRMVAGLLRPTSGRILFKGQPVWQLGRSQFRTYRRGVQIIHQDPYASLNPTQTVYRILSAPLFRHGLARNHRQAAARVQELMSIVDLTPPEDFVDKYPHQLSGGQRQRVSVARVLTVNPSFIVADEAVSMVDVSIRVSLLNMLYRLREQLGVTFLFITHDLALAKYFAWGGRIAVMYLGRIIEVGPTPEVIGDPQHPYTQALLGAVPEADPEVTRSKKRAPLRSLDIPSLLNRPSGCTFHPRCPIYQEGLCDAEPPSLEAVGERHQAACYLAGWKVA